MKPAVRKSAFRVTGCILPMPLDLSTRTYSVFLDGSLVKAQIRFDRAVPIETLRFFTDILNETNFAGRCFDNLRINAP